MTIHAGGCLCGQLRFAVSAEPLQSGYCHCRMCQKNSGAPVVAWVTFPSASFAWMAGRASTYESSPRARREFCAHCGSYLVFRTRDYPDEVSINTASLDDPAAFPPRMHIFTESRVPWLHIHDALPVYIGYGPVGPGA